MRGKSLRKKKGVKKLSLRRKEDLNMNSKSDTIIHQKYKKSKGSGSIYFVDDRKKYRAQYTTPQGKRISKMCATLKEAEDWLAQQRTDIAQGTFVEPSKVTLGQWMVTWLETYKKPTLAASTYERYLQLALHLEPLAKIPLQKLTSIEVQQLFNEMELTETGKNKVYKILSQAIKRAIAIDLLRKNFLLAVEAPKPLKTQMETYTTEEINHLLDVVKHSVYYSKYYPFILLAVTSGARIGELLGLKITQVLSDRIRIREKVDIKKRKGKLKTEAAYRDITLPPEVIASIKSAYKVSPIIVGGYVFHTSTGNAYGMRNIERMWEKVLEEASLPHLNFHSLRHYHATYLLSIGVPIAEVSKRLGHAKISITLDYYGHAIPGYDSTIAQMLAPICTQTAHKEEKTVEK